MSSIPVQIGASIQGGRWLTHAQSQAMGGRYHQKYMNFKPGTDKKEMVQVSITKQHRQLKSGTANE